MQRLDDWREQRNLTLEQLAEKLGIAGKGRARTVQRYESGERFPGRSMLRRIHQVTEGAVTAEAFVGPQTADRVAA